MSELQIPDRPVAEVLRSVAPPQTLTARLNAKLSELTAAGYDIRWIEVSPPDLVKLFEEGGDDAIQLDADPECDRAWYGPIEVRPTDRACIWVYLEGEADAMSCHVVG